MVSGVDRQKELLQKVSTMTVTEPVQWYKQCLNVLAWSEHKAFIDPYIVGVGCYTELEIIEDPQVNSEWDNMAMKMYGQFLHDSAALLERISYKMQRRKHMVVFADVNATLGARSNREQLPEENAKTVKLLTESAATRARSGESSQQDLL